MDLKWGHQGILLAVQLTSLPMVSRSLARGRLLLFANIPLSSPLNPVVMHPQ